MEKKKKIYLGIAIASIVLAIVVGIGVFKTLSKTDIEGESLNASTSSFYCKISNAYGDTKSISTLGRIYVYGHCQNTKTKMRSITTYYMTEQGNIIGDVSSIGYWFNYRTVNTSLKMSYSKIKKLFNNGKSTKMKVKICAKDQQGYIVCSPDKTVSFSK